MTSPEKPTPQVITINNAPHTLFKGVDFAVLLPREKSEGLEVLLERFGPGLCFPTHRHEECVQFYFIIEGKAEVTLVDRKHVVDPGQVVHIPRLTDHAIANVGKSDLVYLNIESYPDGYLPNEMTWQTHIDELTKRVGDD